MNHPDIKIFDHDVHYDYRGELWTIWEKEKYPNIELNFNHDKISTSKKKCFKGFTW